MSRGPASRLYWTIIFIVALLLTILCLNTLIIDYLGYPVDTTVTYDNANIVSRLSYSFLYMSEPVRTYLI
jgi:hypothetical protein